MSFDRHNKIQNLNIDNFRIANTAYKSHALQFEKKNQFWDKFIGTIFLLRNMKRLHQMCRSDIRITAQWA